MCLFTMAVSLNLKAVLFMWAALLWMWKSRAYLEPVEEGGERVLAADAVFVYVSISETGRPLPIRRHLEGEEP